MNMEKNEIWMVDLNPTIGAEISKIRPAVIINRNSVGKLPLRIIAPITDFKPHYREVEWMVEIKANPENGLSKHSAIDCFQLKSVSTNRFIRKIGKINQITVDEIADCLYKIFEL